MPNLENEALVTPDVAWNLFEKSPPGWARIQAICDFVHRHIAFGYEHARPTMTSHPGDLRFRPSPHRLRLRACAPDDDVLGGLQ
jgi:hypothetical protein